MTRGTAIILLLICAIVALAVQSARQHQRQLDASLRELKGPGLAETVALADAEDVSQATAVYAGVGAERSIDRSLEVRVSLEPLLVEPQQRS